MLERTPPEVEPLLLAEAKRHLRVDHDEEDDLILSLITAARERAEVVTRRSLADSLFTLHLRRPRPVIRLPRPPVLSLEGMEYDSREGTVVAWDPEHRLDKVSAPGALYIYEGAPADLEVGPGAFRVRYRAGYTQQTLPRSIAQAMLLMVGHWFAHREEVVTGTIATSLPMAAKSLLWGHRVSVYR